MLHLHTKKLGKVRWEFQAEPKADGVWDTPERWGKPDSGPMELEMRDHMDRGENGFNNHIFLFYFSPKLATRALSHGSHQLSYRSRSLEVSEGLSNLPRGSQRINRSCPLIVPPQFLSQSQVGSDETSALWVVHSSHCWEVYATSYWPNCIFEVKPIVADLRVKFTGWSLLWKKKWARNRIL